MLTIGYILLAILGLGILVFVHEFGHYIVAKAVGMRVDVFSIGFGKPLIKWRWQSVDWQIGWLPFGGYVKIAGMEFSKDDKVEPYEVAEGFFAQAPWKRIAVALAGPTANFIIALLILCSLWMIGGRVKPFSEYTQVVGWVDPNSEAFAKGVRPGDILYSYNGHPYTSTRDLLHASMMEGAHVTLDGAHKNYTTGKATPFQYTIDPYLVPGSLSEIKTIGITKGASYLIYDKVGGFKENALKQGLPITDSGIQYEDQIVWAQGERVFSIEQLGYLLNTDTVLLTILRDNKKLLSRQPKILLSELNPQGSFKNELIDWYYDSDYEGGVSSQFIIPYQIDFEGVVKGEVAFIDSEAKRKFFPLYPFQSDLEAPLKRGDKIISVGGEPVFSGLEIFQKTQKRPVVLIVKDKQEATLLKPLNQQQEYYLSSFEAKALQELTQKVGEGSIAAYQGYRLLKPFSSIPFSRLTEEKEIKEQWEQQQKARLEEIEQIQDPEKRELALEQIEKMQTKQVLGIVLQDRQIEYNPSPLVLLGNVVEETLQTLKALFVGSLNPKWLGGPIGIVYIIQQGWRTGLGEALFWMAAISLNLGIFNLLPIPVLDGGYICLSIYEWITGHKLSAKTMERLILPFAILIIGLLLFLTVQDLSRLI